MRIQSKADLLKENHDLSVALGARDSYLSHAFRGEVTFISKGKTRLGICGENCASGGVVLEAQRDNAGKWFVCGVYYWESFYARVRSFPYRHDDVDGQNLRTCAEQVARHVAKKQGDFYAQKTAEALGV